MPRHTEHRKEINPIPSPLGEGQVNKPIIQHHQGEVATRIEWEKHIGTLRPYPMSQAYATYPKLPIEP